MKNKPAFPRPSSEFNSNNWGPQEGMTLREYYAGLAMLGMIQSAPIVDRTKIDKKAWAKVACEWADALIAELEKSEE